MLLLPDPTEDCSGLSERDERDRPLSFHWRTLDYERIHALGVPLHKDRDRNRARNSILTEAVLAYEEGRWVSYSRRKEFYVGLSRYHGTAYTYATIMPVIEELLRPWLIEEERSSPHQRGKQSRFRATPRLIEGLAEARFEYELHGLIRLKDASDHLIGFTDTRDTRRMHRELEEINSCLGAVDLQLVAPDVIRTNRHLIVDGAYYGTAPRGAQAPSRPHRGRSASRQGHPPHTPR